MSGLRAQAYHVVANESHWCKHCGEGLLFDVISPDGFATGTSFRNKVDADETAAMLSRAYEQGRESKS